MYAYINVYIYIYMTIYNISVTIHKTYTDINHDEINVKTCFSLKMNYTKHETISV